MEDDCDPKCDGFDRSKVIPLIRVLDEHPKLQSPEKLELLMVDEFEEFVDGELDLSDELLEVLEFMPVYPQQDKPPFACGGELVFELQEGGGQFMVWFGPEEISRELLLEIGMSFSGGFDGEDVFDRYRDIFGEFSAPYLNEGLDCGIEGSENLFYGGGEVPLDFDMDAWCETVEEVVEFLYQAQRYQQVLHSASEKFEPQN